MLRATASCERIHTSDEQQAYEGGRTALKAHIAKNDIPASSLLVQYAKTASGGRGYRVVLKDASLTDIVKERIRSWTGHPAELQPLTALPAE